MKHPLSAKCEHSTGLHPVKDLYTLAPVCRGPPRTGDLTHSDT